MSDLPYNTPLVVTRDLSADEQFATPPLHLGDRVFQFAGPTYGCIRWDTGTACSRVNDEGPFFEVPLDALAVASDPVNPSDAAVDARPYELPDYGKLRLLAMWFDGCDDQEGVPDDTRFRTVQSNLRRIAARLETSESSLLDKVEALTKENEALRTKVWRHGDKCSLECTPACDEMHTYQAGCWFAPKERPDAE